MVGAMHARRRGLGCAALASSGMMERVASARAEASKVATERAKKMGNQSSASGQCAARQRRRGDAHVRRRSSAAICRRCRTARSANAAPGSTASAIRFSTAISISTPSAGRNRSTASSSCCRARRDDSWQFKVQARRRAGAVRQSGLAPRLRARRRQFVFRVPHPA